MTQASTKLLSWNLNGIRACLTKGLDNSINRLNPDIIAFQEIKAESAIVQEIALKFFPDYKLHCSSAEKAGYSGVACLVRNDSKHSSLAFDTQSSGLPVELYNKSDLELLRLFESEGRFSILRSKKLTLVNTYIPSGTSGEHRQALKMQFLDIFSVFVKAELKQQKNVILCGDFNICHKEIDIHHPKEATKRRLTGFLPEERAWISELIDSSYIDCFRYKYPDLASQYSWWSYRANARAKNLGWRIDYFFCSSSLSKSIIDAKIHSEIAGSDHCPISLDLCLD